MKVYNSSEATIRAVGSKVSDVISSISETYLRNIVETISIPRHFLSESINNRFVAEWITKQLDSYGYITSYQGSYANVIGMPRETIENPLTLIGAHYDSVPDSPGADDNASALAALLGCAKAVSEYIPRTPVCFAAFNREEDGLLGSADFVSSFLRESRLRLGQVHILEMVGYCSEFPNSQSMPSSLPVSVPSVGNFLGVLGNRDSGHLLGEVLANAKAYLPEFPVVGLEIQFGMERFISDLLRSDHAPFWMERIPALMWTDTAEFRNPNYHQNTDTPDTLDYSFLRRVTQLLLIQGML